MESSQRKPLDDDETKRKSIMLKFTNEDYLTIRATAFERGLEMGPMLAGLLAPLVRLLRTPKDHS